MAGGAPALQWPRLQASRSPHPPSGPQTGSIGITWDLLEMQNLGPHQTSRIRAQSMGRMPGERGWCRRTRDPTSHTSSSGL